MSSGRPAHVVVMGVTGTGKSSIGRALADALDWVFIEGDAVHPAANIAKMRAGIPLTDEDRIPWLEALGWLTAQRDAEGRSTVVASSALRRMYRDLLRGAVPDGPTFFVHLVAPSSVLLGRMRARDHFMPPALLDSQFDALEPLSGDEDGVMIDVDRPPADVLGEALATVRARFPDTVGHDPTGS